MNRRPPSQTASAELGISPCSAKADAASGQEVLVRGATAIIPQRLITDGEVVVLAIKPSLWFILLTSLRWLVGAALVIAVAELAKPWVSLRIAQRAEQLAVLAGVVRLLVGALEWLGRVYVLTDRRVMRLKGVVHIDLFDCSLGRVQQTVLTLPLAERAVLCGTILFYTAGTDTVDAAWKTVARPAQVYQTVIEAIENYRRRYPQAQAGPSP